MKVDFNASQELYSITQELLKMPELVEKEEKALFKKCEKIIVKKLKDNLNRSDGEHLSNYDGSKPYKHIIDDIKASIKSKQGFISLTICGGKMTAYKWHLVNDGTRDGKGRTKTKATHFIDKAMAQSKSEIESLVDEMVRKVADGNTN